MREEPPRRPRRLLLGEDEELTGGDSLEDGVSFEEDDLPEEAGFFVSEPGLASPLERPFERAPPRRPRVRRTGVDASGSAGRCDSVAGSPEGFPADADLRRKKRRLTWLFYTTPLVTNERVLQRAATCSASRMKACP